MSSAVASNGGVSGLAPPEIWRLCLTWLERSTEIITQSAAGLDAINVFPVPDSDTGTNLQQTLTGITSYLGGEVAEAHGPNRTTISALPIWSSGPRCCPPTATPARSSPR